jgi:hypothetical protein
VKSPSCSPSSAKTEDTKKGSYGKQLNFNCYVKLKRLSLNNLSSMQYALGQIRKIPFKEYMDEQHTSKKHQQSASVTQKRPILTSYLVDKQPVSLDHSVNNNNAKVISSSSSRSSTNSSVKRKSNNEHGREKPKQISINKSRTLFHDMARDIESLGDLDPAADSISDQDDLETWCLSKALGLIDKYKPENIHKQKSGDRK